MNELYKSKSQVREELKSDVEKFLSSGGKIEVIAPKKAPKQKMRAKNDRSARTPSSLL